MTHEQAAADLAYMRQLMERSRRVTVLGGHYLIAWGVLVELALVVTWLAATGRAVMNPLWAWAGAVVLGWAYTFWSARRDRRVDGASSRNGFLVGIVWVSLGVAMTLVFFVGMPAETIGWQAAPGLAAAFLGAGALLHGTLAGIGWFRVVAAGWWLTAAAMLLWPGRETLLLYAGAVLVLQILPGVVLDHERRQLLLADA